HESEYESGLASALSGPEHRPHADFTTAPGVRPRDRALILCLGSNIGNFDPPDVAMFLERIRASVTGGDALLLRAGLLEPEHELLIAYDDPLGVSAAFNRNLLVRANRDLGADFDLDSFVHRAVWNADARRVEMHLVSTHLQHACIPAARMEITLQREEPIW